MQWLQGRIWSSAEHLHPPACSPPTLPAAVLRGPGGGIADFSSPGAQPSPPAAAGAAAPQPVAWRGPPQEGGGGLFGGPAAATPQAAAAETDVGVISDRKVRLPQPSEPEPSLYRLCRQWVQNDPDLLPPDEVGRVGPGDCSSERASVTAG